MLSEGKTEEEALKILEARSRDNSRTPMQWSSGKNAGFSEAELWISLPDNYETINVEAQREDKTSVLNFYRRLIRLRKEHSVISEGSVRFLETGNEKVIGYVRENSQEKLTVLCNFSGMCQEFEGAKQEYSKKARLLVGNWEAETAPAAGTDSAEPAKTPLRPFEVRALLEEKKA